MICNKQYPYCHIKTHDGTIIPPQELFHRMTTPRFYEQKVRFILFICLILKFFIANTYLLAISSISWSSRSSCTNKIIFSMF